MNQIDIMADPQKIHPVHHDVEAQNHPSAPLVPRSMSKSDAGDPQRVVVQQQQQNIPHFLHGLIIEYTFFGIWNVLFVDFA